jgi:opacity protein-like surface antigen
MTDIFVGLYGDTMLGDKTRIYVGAGPLLQWVNLNIDWDDPGSGHVHTSESGFGYGYYARTGIDFMVRPGMYVGLGARWIDAQADFNGIVNEFNTEGVQYFMTFTEFL